MRYSEVGDDTGCRNKKKRKTRKEIIEHDWE